MSLVTIDNTTLASIANAIREKNGTTDAYKPSEMPTAISNIETGGGSGGAYAPRYIKFAGYTGTELDYELENLDTSQVTSMSEMFKECTKLTSLAPKFDVTNVTSMYYFSYGNTSLSTADLSSFGVSAVKNTSYMFANCSKLQSVNLENFVTPDLGNASYMFNLCNILRNINVSKMVTTNVTNMSYMFRGTKVTELDLSNFETPNVTNMGSMFYQCSSLTRLDIRNFTFDKVTSYSNMFAGVPTNCRIIVKDDTAKAWIREKFSNLGLTNIKTVAEL